MIIPIRLLDTNYSYIVTNGDELFIVDPGESSPILDYLTTNMVKPTGILITHHHHDHIDGVDEILYRYPNVTLYDFKTKGEDLLDFNIEKIMTPGHTSDSCCFYLKSEKAVLTGDTLFTGLCGRVMDRVSYMEMHQSLQALSKLPGETKIYPGHEYLQNSIEFMDKNNYDSTFYKSLHSKLNPSLNSNIEFEIKNNPFMTTKFEDFKKIRILKG